MRAFHDGMPAIILPGRLQLLVATLMLLVLVAPPTSFSLYGKDKDKPEKEQKVKDDEVKVPESDKETDAETSSDAPIDAGNDKPEKERKPKEKHRDKNKEKVKEKGKEKEKSKGKGKEKDSGDAGEKDATVIARKIDDSASLAAAEAECRLRLTPAIDMAASSRAKVQELAGYSCTFIKQEQISKKGPLMRTTMTLKFRREPFSVYLKYLDPHPGREVIYVDGQNKGKLQVHEPSGLASFVGIISLAPTGGEALKENRYPVTMIGMEKMLDTLIAEWEEAVKDTDTQVQFYPQAKLGEAECVAVEVTHPQQRESCKSHNHRVYFEKKTKFPIRCERYGFPTKTGEQAPLIEEYTYLDVKPEGSIADRDFDVSNEKYGFK